MTPLKVHGSLASRQTNTSKDQSQVRQWTRETSPRQHVLAMYDNIHRVPTCDKQKRWTASVLTAPSRIKVSPFVSHTAASLEVHLTQNWNTIRNTTSNHVTKPNKINLLKAQLLKWLRLPWIGFPAKTIFYPRQRAQQSIKQRNSNSLVPNRGTRVMQCWGVHDVKISPSRLECHLNTRHGIYKHKRFHCNVKSIGQWPHSKGSEMPIENRWMSRRQQGQKLRLILNQIEAKFLHNVNMYVLMDIL